MQKFKTILTVVGILVVISVSVFSGVNVGLKYGSKNTEAMWRKDAIERGFAIYGERDGVWKWLPVKEVILRNTAESDLPSLMPKISIEPEPVMEAPHKKKAKI